MLTTFSNTIANVIKNKIAKKKISPALIFEEKHKNFTDKEYYEDKIARLRESKDEEVKQFLIITKNHIKREYEATLDVIKKKYKSLLLGVKQECLSLKEIIQNRDIFINRLCNIISDMELYTTNTRIVNSRCKSDKKHNEDTNPLDENFYLEQIYNVTQHNDILKETCILYQKEIDSLNAKTKKIQEITAKNEKGLKNEIEKLKETIKEKEIEYDKKINYFLKE